MWEGTERDFRRFEEDLMDFLTEQGWDHIELGRESGPDLRAKAKRSLKRDEYGFLEEPIVVRMVLK